MKRLIKKAEQVLDRYLLQVTMSQMVRPLLPNVKTAIAKSIFDPVIEQINANYNVQAEYVYLYKLLITGESDKEKMDALNFAIEQLTNQINDYMLNNNVPEYKRPNIKILGNYIEKPNYITL